MPFRQARWKIRLARLNRQARFSSFRILALLFLVGCSSQVAVPNKAAGIYHIVNRGENLFRIGQAYGVSFRELADVNGIQDAHRIRVGQKIFIPGADRQLPVTIITPVKASVEKPGGSGWDEREANGFIWPVVGNVASGFGPRGSNFHDGIDISVSEGTSILAVDSGEVIYSDALRGYGNLVIIRHQGGLTSVYAHNRKNLVREGQKVGKGEIIAEVGSTGRVSAPHLHFEIRKDNIARNPVYYLP